MNPTSPTRYLLPSENRVIEVRRHPAILIRPILQSAVVVVVALAASYRWPYESWVQTVCWWLAILAVLRLAWVILEYVVERFIVTDQRVLLTSGILVRRVAMMPLRKVTDMTYERSVIGQLLGYGAFIVESAGQDQALSRIEFLPDPDALYLQVSDLLFGRPLDDAD